jgi:hypothetical protein
MFKSPTTSQEEPDLLVSPLRVMSAMITALRSSRITLLTLSKVMELEFIQIHLIIQMSAMRDPIS